MSRGLLLVSIITMSACLTRSGLEEVRRQPPPPVCDSGLGTSLPAPLPQSTGAAYYVDPTGDDDGPGTLAAPWRTLQKAFDTLVPGEIAHLRAGTYGASGDVHMFTADGGLDAPITVQGYDGDVAPIIRGQVRISGAYLRLSGLSLIGPSGDVGGINNGEEQLVVIDTTAHHVEISNCDIEQGLLGGIRNHGASSVQIIASTIRDNRDPTNPGLANQMHGIDWSAGTGLIASCLVIDNDGYGIHLWPNADGVIVTGNTVVGNGVGGFVIGGNSTVATDDALLINNIIAFNSGWGVGAVLADVAGTGNLVRNNVIWGNPEGTVQPPTAGEDNVVLDPAFVSTGTMPYELAPTSPAIDAAIVDYAFPTDLTGRCRSQGDGPDLGAFEVVVP